MSLSKWAVDSVAKDYWSQYYKEYGKTWVRDIPRRVKKAMADNKKVASVDDAGTVAPVATSVTAEGVTLEGMYRDASNKNFLFVATFNHDGEVLDFDSVELTNE